MATGLREYLSANLAMASPASKYSALVQTGRILASERIFTELRCAGVVWLRKVVCGNWVTLMMMRMMMMRAWHGGKDNNQKPVLWKGSEKGKAKTDP